MPEASALKTRSEPVQRSATAPSYAARPSAYAGQPYRPAVAQPAAQSWPVFAEKTQRVEQSVSVAQHDALISQNRYLLCSGSDQLWLVDIALSSARLWLEQGAEPLPLLMPVRLTLQQTEQAVFARQSGFIKPFGF